ncbi:MAG: helix-turn-helix domain-containing protein [Flavobacteriaceae bacterium]
MDVEFDIREMIKAGIIKSELDFDLALIAERKLRVLAKENPEYKTLRKRLRDLIEVYENQNWAETSKIPEAKLHESDRSEFIAEKERLFVQRRKEIIRKKLKQLNLSQQDFGAILGHQNKSYISELINGLRPFSLKDLIVINRLFKIELTDLVPTFIGETEQIKIKSTIRKLNNPKLKLSKKDLELV